MPRKAAAVVLALGTWSGRREACVARLTNACSYGAVLTHTAWLARARAPRNGVVLASRARKAGSITVGARVWIVRACSAWNPRVGRGCPCARAVASSFARRAIIGTWLVAVLAWLARSARVLACKGVVCAKAAICAGDAAIKGRVRSRCARGACRARLALVSPRRACCALGLSKQTVKARAAQTALVVKVHLRVGIALVADVNGRGYAV